MNLESVFMSGALLVAAIGCATDVESRRIPNRLAYPAILIALTARAALQGWHGVASGLEGGLIAGGAFFAFFLLHAMGAGDVKLMTAVGCAAGVGHALEIVLASAIAGGIFAILHSLLHRRLRVVLGNVVELARFHVLAGAEAHPTLNLSNPQAVRMPYGVAIAAGALYSALAFYCRGGV
jgi:prepilin peptidase CpaA